MRGDKKPRCVALMRLQDPQCSRSAICKVVSRYSDRYPATLMHCNTVDTPVVTREEHPVVVVESCALERLAGRKLFATCDFTCVEK